MKCQLSRLLPVLLLAATSAFAQTEAASPPTIPVLHNGDVLRMVQQGIKPGKIISTILTSSCNFDTFPPIMQDLMRRGVPDTVLMAMKMVPYGPPAMVVGGPPKTVVAPARSQVQIPAGTVIDIEAAEATSSADLDRGNAITFLVSRRVFINGVLVIDRGAVANARIIKSKRAGSWGRGGTFEFAMENVVAVDGTRVPIRLSNEVKGNNHTTAVAAAAIVTGAIGFPYASPAALIWALKKGDDAVLEQGTKLTAVVGNNQEIAGLLPEKKKPTYLSVDSINLANRSQGSGVVPFNNSFRPTPIRRK
jgi:hypothetical protein